jgi:hypothetical protein
MTDDDLPIFSERLDTVMAAIIAGDAPNAGRFCGYCYTPLPKQGDVCAHCAHTAADYAPVDRLPMEFGGLYRRMRRRESLIVNSFAFGGLALAVALFIGIVALAVYVFDQSIWMFVLATIVLLVGGRVLAGILGGWIGDAIGYRYAHRKLAEEWSSYERERDVRLGRVRASHNDAASANPTTSPSALH